MIFDSSTSLQWIQRMALHRNSLAQVQILETHIHLKSLVCTNPAFSELICDEDVGPMSANLQRIVNNPPPNRVITFRVKTGFEEPNDVLDEPNLTGFAQLSLTD